MVVFPLSGWEIMARLRRLSISEGGARKASDTVLAASSVVENSDVGGGDAWGFGARNADALQNRMQQYIRDIIVAAIIIN